MCTLRIFLTFLIMAAFIATGCSKNSSSDNDSATVELVPFGSDLRTSLPEVNGSSKTRDAYDGSVESYATAKTFGGLFQRVLGNDPASVYFCVNFIDQAISIIKDPANAGKVTLGDTATVTLPFLGDQITMKNTFTYAGTYATTFADTDHNSMMNIVFSDLSGGFSGTMTAIAFRIKLYQSGSTTPEIDCSFIFYAERDSSGKLLVKAARYDDEIKTTSSTGVYQLYFNRPATDAPFIFKTVSKSSSASDTSVFSIIAAGTVNKFVIRRRSEKTGNYVDQYFVAEYDPATKKLGTNAVAAASSTTAFDIDGNGFDSANTGGLGNQFDILSSAGMDAYEADVAASNMFDFSISSIFPADRAAVTPNWTF